MSFREQFAANRIGIRFSARSKNRAFTLAIPGFCVQLPVPSVNDLFLPL
jgi:hypothetical protein